MSEYPMLLGRTEKYSYWEVARGVYNTESVDAQYTRKTTGYFNFLSLVKLKNDMDGVLRMLSGR